MPSRGPISGLANLIGSGINQIMLANDEHRRETSRAPNTATWGPSANHGTAAQAPLEQGMSNLSIGRLGPSTDRQHRPETQKRRSSDSRTSSELSLSSSNDEEEAGEWSFVNGSFHRGVQQAPLSPLAPLPTLPSEEDSKSHGLVQPILIPKKHSSDPHSPFFRTYAPRLRALGIDRGSFLYFLDNLNRALEASSFLEASTVVTSTASRLPLPFVASLSRAASTSMKQAKHDRAHTAANAYLDKANEDIFHPKKLHAFFVRNSELGSADNALGDVDSLLADAAPLEFAPGNAAPGTEQTGLWQPSLAPGRSSDRSLSLRDARSTTSGSRTAPSTTSGSSSHYSARSEQRAEKRERRNERRTEKREHKEERRDERRQRRDLKRGGGPIGAVGLLQRLSSGSQMPVASKGKEREQTRAVYLAIVNLPDELTSRREDRVQAVVQQNRHEKAGPQEEAPPPYEDVQEDDATSRVSRNVKLRMEKQ